MYNLKTGLGNIKTKKDIPNRVEKPKTKPKKQPEDDIFENPLRLDLKGGSKYVPFYNKVGKLKSFTKKK